MTSAALQEEIDLEAKSIAVAVGVPQPIVNWAFSSGILTVADKAVISSTQPLRILCTGQIPNGFLGDGGASVFNAEVTGNQNIQKMQITLDDSAVAVAQVSITISASRRPD